eukprot:145025-Prorocentrum_lima.AAC.1
MKNSMRVRATLTELSHAISRLDTTLAGHLSSFPDMAEYGSGTPPSVSMTQGNTILGPVTRDKQDLPKYVQGTVAGLTPDTGTLVLGALDSSTAAECYYTSSS